MSMMYVVEMTTSPPKERLFFNTCVRPKPAGLTHAQVICDSWETGFKFNDMPAKTGPYQLWQSMLVCHSGPGSSEESACLYARST